METNKYWHFPLTGREGDAERTVYWDNTLTGLSLLNRLWDFFIFSVNSPSLARPYAPWEAQVEGCYAALPRRQIILLLLRTARLFMRLVLPRIIVGFVRYVRYLTVLRRKG